MNTLPILTRVLETVPAGYGGTDGPDFTQYGSLILALLVTVGFLAWAFKRVVGGTLRRKAEQRALQVCDVLPLGNKQRLCVVRCYDRSFFIGVTDRHVELIAELDAAAIANSAPVEKATATQSKSPLGAEHKDAFLRALKRVTQDQPASLSKPKIITPPAATPVRAKKTVRRKAPVAAPVAETTPVARKRPAPKPTRRLDDGRGMLA